MKREAERQLTKDGDGDDEIEEIQDPQGFQKADKSVLAERQIRALPKRALAASKPSPPNGLVPVPAQEAEKVDTVSPPKFGNFAGFGGAAASNPFTFTSPSVAPSASDTAFKPTQPTTTLNSTTVSPFSGLPTPSPMDADTSPKPTTPLPGEETDAIAFKYFKSLRGLNVSFLSAISAAVEKDPFCDVANLIESYKNLRTTIQSEFDTSSQPFASRAPVATNSVPPFDAKTSSEKAILSSTPQSSDEFAEASPKVPPTSESSTKPSGFTFPAFVPPSSFGPAQLPFGLTFKPSEPSSSTTPPEPPKSTFTFDSSRTSASKPTSGFSFVAPQSTGSSTSKSATPSNQETENPSATLSSRPASTAPSFGSSSVPNFFANTAHTNPFGISDATSKPTSIFGSSIFGSSSVTEVNKSPLFTPPSFDTKDASKASTSLFGNLATPSMPTSIFGSSSDKPTSSFGSASPPKTTAFVFGKPGGSIGNPVGFGFGGSPSSSGDTTSQGLSGSAFSFGAPLAKPSESLFSPPVTDKSTESTPQPDADGNEGGEEEVTKLLPSHTHDEEGEGEEDEETTHVVRCKVYRLSKSDDRSEWKDLGVGMFRLKKHKVTNVRRALMRNSNTGRILINFRMYASLKPLLAKTSISFIGYEDNTPTSFRIRVKAEEQAEELKNALERETAAIQAE